MKDVLIDALCFVLVDALIFVLVGELVLIPIDAACFGTCPGTRVCCC